jgi:hypothetical protein
MPALIVVLWAVLFADSQDRDWSGLRAKLDQLTSADVEERLQARSAAKGWEPGVLLEGLNDRTTRETAALALGVLGENKALGVLRAMSAGPDLQARALAFEAMSDLRVDSGIFVAALSSEPVVAFAAARSLGKRSKKGDLHFPPPASSSEMTLVIARELAIEVADGSGDYPANNYLNRWNPKVTSAALLALAQLDSMDSLLVKPNGDLGALLHAVRLRKDLQDADLELAALLMVRCGLASPEELRAFLSHPSARLRARVTERLAATGIARCEIGAWLETLENPALGRHEALAVERAIEKGSGVPVEGSPAQRLQAWRTWWSKSAGTALEQDVAGAVERGTAWLKRQVKDSTPLPYGKASFGPGGTMLAAYTLLMSGVPVDDPVLAAQLKWLETAEPPRPYSVYEAAIAAMVFSEGAERDPKRRVRYRECMAAASEALVRSQDPSGAWGYPASAPKGPGYPTDNSNTQFAILGLRAAENHGAKVPPAVWASAEAYQRRSMHGGGWAYYEKGDPTHCYGSMTAAGLGGLLIARASRKGRAPADFLKDEDAVSGLKWLERNWGMEGHVPAATGMALGSSYYWLWSLERCCLLSGISRIGEHDWYQEGAKYLLARQRADGEWKGPEALADHCFALLFLKRAYVSVATPGGRPATKPKPDTATEK